MYSTARTGGCTLVGMGLAAFRHGVHSMSKRSGHRVRWVYPLVLALLYVCTCTHAYVCMYVFMCVYGQNVM